MIIVCIILMDNNYTEKEQYHSYNTIIQKSESRGELLLGDFNAAVNEEMLGSRNVKTIITAAMGFDHLKVPNGITHIVFPLSDVKSENISAYFQESYQIIEQNLKKGGVLVHCGAGVSRSATLVIAYIMKNKKETFKNTIAYVRNIRSIICPNLGFEMQLKKYQVELGINEMPKQQNVKTPINAKRLSNTHHNSQDSKLVQSQKNVYNNSFFNFEIDLRKPTGKKPQRKTLVKTNAKSRPRAQINSNNFKRFYEVVQTNLFISGKAASRAVYSSNNQSDIGLKNKDITGFKTNASHRNPMLGTWGPIKKNSRQL